MAKRGERGDGHRRPRPRTPLGDREDGPPEAPGGMSHVELVAALRATDGLRDVTGGSDDRPNFHLRHKPFLHFHTDPVSGGTYADVKLGGGPSADFEPVWASTPSEREDLLRRVRKHVRRAGGADATWLARIHRSLARPAMAATERRVASRDDLRRDGPRGASAAGTSSAPAVYRRRARFCRTTSGTYTNSHAPAVTTQRTRWSAWFRLGTSGRAAASSTLRSRA